MIWLDFEDYSSNIQFGRRGLDEAQQTQSPVLILFSKSSLILAICSEVVGISSLSFNFANI